MGYDTYFNGELTVEPPLSPEERALLTLWEEDGSNAPDGAPRERWNPWTANAEGTEISGPDDASRAYDHREWLHFILGYFSGHRINGAISWDGEESEDFGNLVVKDSQLYIEQGYHAYHPEKLYVPEGA